jgi:hypothetical protein
MAGGPETAAARGGLIVEDDAEAMTAGQMRKSEFLAELRVQACAAADRELARAGRDTNGCPHVERLLAHYAGKPAAHLERAIRKFVPGASATLSAREYIPLVAERMASGVRTWVETGQIPSDIPEELQGEMMAAEGIGGALSAVLGAVGSALSAIGGLFFKPAPGGARRGTDRDALSARLGPGRPLEAAARTRMESAFGQSFGAVRLHDDVGAAGLARDLGAHAFTLGTHVAFADGTYRPGTPVGDALLAHELAHVVQQGGAAGSAPPAGTSAASDGLVEHDADQAAAGAVAALYAPGRAPHDRLPRVRGGLRLSRCKASSTKGPPFASVEVLIANVKACDGGLGLWEKATKSNGGKPPKVVAGSPSGGFAAQANITTGTITIDPKDDVCVGTESLIHELSNLSRGAAFTALSTAAGRGEVSREDFIRGNERIEYETGVLNMLKAFDACSEKWGCLKGQVGDAEGFRSAKSFDDYFDNFLLQSHKDHFGKFWDDHFKTAWEAKNKKKDDKKDKKKGTTGKTGKTGKKKGKKKGKKP